MVVIDASLVVKLLVVEQFSIQARRLIFLWDYAGIRLVAPDLMPAEVLSAFLKKVQDGSVTGDYAKESMARLHGMEIELHPSSGFHNRALDLAVELRQRMPYDSYYLALAEALNCEYWTADQPFYRAARQGYPRVRWVGNLTET